MGERNTKKEKMKENKKFPYKSRVKRNKLILTEMKGGQKSNE